MNKKLIIGTIVLLVFIIVIMASLKGTKLNSIGSLNRSYEYNSLKILSAYRSCADIENFKKILPKNGNAIDYKKIANINFAQNPLLMKIESASLKNDFCGVISTTFLTNFYLNHGPVEKARDKHKRIIELVNKNNKTAIADLCIGANGLALYEQQMHSCELLVSNNLNEFDKSLKELAIFLLSKEYFQDHEADKLISLYEKSEYRDILFTMQEIPHSVMNLANNFYKENNFEKALSLYKKISKYDKNGVSEFLIGEMYANGEAGPVDLELAIEWHLQSLKKNRNMKAGPMVINNLGNIYERNRQYVEAFNRYQEAALLGNSLAQFNLGRLYVLGHGTLRDPIEAYAWINIAILQGLDQEKQQEVAENVKKEIFKALNQADETGDMLKQAELLSQKYYKQLILKEKVDKDKK